MKKNNTKRNRWISYIAVAFITFFAAACIGYFAVSSNSSSIGDFVKNMFAKDSDLSSTSSDITADLEVASSLTSASSQLASTVMEGNFIGESSAVDATYFKHGLFIGDEQLIELSNSSAITLGQVLADGTLTPMNVATKKIFPDEDGSYLTLYDALQYYNPDQIYLMFSCAMLSNGTADGIVSAYTDLIDELQEMYPEIPIVLELVLPVTENYGGTYTARSNGKIDSLNELLISEFCEKDGVSLLNIPPDLVSTSDALKTEYASDGYRLNEDGYSVWAKYMKTHTYSK